MKFIIIQIIFASISFCAGLVVGMSAASSYYEKIYVEYWEKKMAVFSKKQAVQFILADVPSELALIQSWINKHIEYVPILLDYFKCRRHELAINIYDFIKEQE